MIPICIGLTGFISIVSVYAFCVHAQQLKRKSLLENEIINESVRVASETETVWEEKLFFEFVSKWTVLSHGHSIQMCSHVLILTFLVKYMVMILCVYFCTWGVDKVAPFSYRYWLTQLRRLYCVNKTKTPIKRVQSILKGNWPEDPPRRNFQHRKLYTTAIGNTETFWGRR